MELVNWNALDRVQFWAGEIHVRDVEQQSLAVIKLSRETNY